VKLVAVFYGLLSIALVLVAQHLGNILQAAIALFGLIGSPVFGLFILGKHYQIYLNVKIIKFEF